jgi:hypothetical protein
MDLRRALARLGFLQPATAIVTVCFTRAPFWAWIAVDMCSAF